jgi:DNA adenine methylase
VPDRFVEPFAGGTIVGLTVACEELAKHVTLVELDDQVAAVWETIFSDKGGGEWLARRILDLDLTLGIVERILSSQADSTRERAFQTILKNRAYHGGILAPGSAPIKSGENGRGIRSRWYPQTLYRRILSLVSVRNRVTFIHGDGLVHLADAASEKRTAFFIDPPYTAGDKKAGVRLYTHYDLDHARLFDVAASLSGPFLMTYDNDGAILALAQQRGFAALPVAMKNTHHATMTELLISRDLGWAV